MRSVGLVETETFFSEEKFLAATKPGTELNRTLRNFPVFHINISV